MNYILFDKQIRLDYSKSTKNRKQTDIVQTIGLLAVLFSVFTIGYSYAGTWIDKFDENQLNGWERIREENPWFAKWELIDGVLYSQVLNRIQEHLTKADFLQWNAHQFQLKRIRVESEDINYTRHNNSMSGQFCLFIGKRIPEPDFAEGYIISPEETTKMKFSAKGVYDRRESVAKYDLMWRLTRGNLKVVFNDGRFRLFTQNILVTEFFDPDIILIDIIGLLILCDLDTDWFEGNISTFSVTGDGIPNHNFFHVQLQSTKLTATWGALKRF